ncbi:hypothetical protein [Kitasatospora sp. GAS204B]|uniref:hypothetical protein n=1 Tax=unclassified Kitasatospora TaxID=2633591 RepID=UPI002475DA56|nr:hypothetical protein [Kitasatospora sp. GAS204B]MDH6122932.1 hypothetical protein [Kitasatospora sp. GAS204B]
MALEKLAPYGGNAITPPLPRCTQDSSTMSTPREPDPIASPLAPSRPAAAYILDFTKVPIHTLMQQQEELGGYLRGQLDEQYESAQEALLANPEKIGEFSELSGLSEQFLRTKSPTDRDLQTALYHDFQSSGEENVLKAGAWDDETLRIFLPQDFEEIVSENRTFAEGMVGLAGAHILDKGGTFEEPSAFPVHHLVDVIDTLATPEYRDYLDRTTDVSREVYSAQSMRAALVFDFDQVDQIFPRERQETLPRRSATPAPRDKPWRPYSRTATSRSSERRTETKTAARTGGRPGT